MSSDREQGLVAGLVQHVGPLLTRERWALAGLVVLAVPTGLVEAVVVALVAEVAVTMAAGSSRVVAELGPLSVEMAVSRALLMGLALAAARLVLRVGMAYLPARIVANAQARLRRELFEDFVRAGWATQAQERDGHLQEVMTTQVNRIARLLWQAAQGLGALLVFLGLAVSAFLVSPVAAGAMLLLGAALFGLLRPLAGVARAQSTAASGASVDLAAAVNEAVRVGEEHHVFGTGHAQSAEVEGRVEEVRRPFLRALFASRAAGNSYQGLVFILLVAGLAGLRLAGVGDLAAVGATVLILLRSLSYGQEAQTAYTTVNDNLPYLRRAVDAHERYREALEPDGSEPLENIETLRFDQVSYAYDRDEDALRDVSFSLASGEAIGIIGPSGAGKSTLVQILLRLRRPDTGRYTINDLPAHRYARDDWTQRVSYVPQEPKLIHGTVADNIRFYRDGISDAAVEEAARAAHIHAEITAWPEGYARLVGQRANAVSGGQRQRLCLARALVTRPQLLVLDEPTSALDPRSERLVQRTLWELHGDGVMLCIIAHRSVTLELVDRVLVLEEGRRVAFGPPGEVAADGGELISELLAGSGVTVPRQQ